MTTTPKLYTPTDEVVEQAVTFRRRRLGEPRDISPEAYARWLDAHDVRVRTDAVRTAITEFTELLAVQAEAGPPAAALVYEEAARLAGIYRDSHHPKRGDA